MKKIVLLMMLFASLTGFKQGNSRRISGRVYDGSNKQPLPGVSVAVAGTNVNAATDMQGFYAINVPDGYNRLSYSFVGYQSQTIIIGKKDTINVFLDGNNKSLNEVIVSIGYGSVKKEYKRRRVTGSPNAEIMIDEAVGNSVATVAAPNPGLPIAPTDPGDESYKGITENGFNNAKDVPLSTFSVDVDGASYSNVRRYINGGQLPPADAVRIEEMLNYFNYNLSGPENGGPVAIHTELSSAPWNPKHRLLRIGLKAKTVPEDKLPPSNLVFLLDVSGSMSADNKLPLVKASMKMLVDELRPQDKVTIVAYAGQAGLVLKPTMGDKKVSIDSAIDLLNADGSTNGGEGIKLAYKFARENYMPAGNNRIIMATDGDFNVGPSSDEDMETLITREKESNVALSIMGVGMGNLKDSKMETLADKGNGNYFYIDNITEARKALISEFGGTLFTVAKDVKLQVEFNPAKVQAYRLIGYEDRLLNKEDFNNDKKDAGDMGSGQTVTALYEIVPAGIKDDYVGTVDALKYQKADPAPVNTSDELLTIKFRYKQPQSMESKMSEAVVKDEPETFNNTTTDFKFTAGIAEFGMLLRDSQYKQKATYDEAITIARSGKGEDNDGYRAEFIKLAESAKLLTKSALVSQ